MTKALQAPSGSRPGSERALALFHRAAREVKAYGAFLAEHHIDARSIRTAAHFATVAPVTKRDYLHNYPRTALMWNGDPTVAVVWSASSGSSGTPTYWPQNDASTADNVELYDRIFERHFDSRRKSTLVVVGFAMGNWIGGTITMRAVERLRERGHRVSVIAPGINDAVLDNIAALGGDYDQVVLAGYPPFVQDVLDRAGSAVLSLDLRLLLAGERITERWRDHILGRIGRAGEFERICLIYGTADIGVMGHETPTTIAVRRLADVDPELALDLFGSADALPTFVEYDPNLRYTEIDEDGSFLFTADTAVPLLRYRINDQGSILSAARVAAVLARHGYCLPVQTSTPDSGFLALRRRTDVSTSYYAVKLFPESVVAALEDPAISPALTGKFVLITRTDDAFTQSLELRVELREQVSITSMFTDQVTEKVLAALDRTNSEFRQLHAVIGDAAVPVVIAEPHGSARFRLDRPKHNYLESNE
ncbi:phenylacetate--CoA ligase family protein [Nocardia takedensis]|uniref:phenylacetate--CoA ligase family protein n=1 Tax=Nocardia takedensis TaxID=259390 RepID=UPI0002F686FF|nr:hypothetical protein [Nocardia takedensis]